MASSREVVPQTGSLPHLHTLLHHEYGLQSAILSPIHIFEVAGRGVYRVDVPNQAPLLLRAYQQDRETMPWLTRSAETLLFLESADYPAPRVHKTEKGALLGSHQGWTGLLLTFIPGEMSTGTVAECWQIGSQLAQLHSLNIKNAASAHPPVPDSRWHPAQKFVEWHAELEKVAGDVPQALNGLYAFSLEILSQIAKWSDLPLAILHTDPNPFNAICTPQNNLVFIDWDNSGIGPAVLDLGHLLLTSHAVLPEWPAVEPNPPLIEALMEGYCAVRTLSAQERQHLPIATCFSDALWAGEAIRQTIGQDWRENRTLTRFGTRYSSLARIGQIAQAKSMV